VSYWQRTGIIPARWHPILLQFAQQLGVDLIAEDFLSRPLAARRVDRSPACEDGNVLLATHKGTLKVGRCEIVAYRLSNGFRVFDLDDVSVALIGNSDARLTDYLIDRQLRGLLPDDLRPSADGTLDALIQFGATQDVSTIKWGLPATRFADLCLAYAVALGEHVSDRHDRQLTVQQIVVAQRAVKMARAFGKVGIDTLVDEALDLQNDTDMIAECAERLTATGAELRIWERALPEQLWKELARLTKRASDVRPRSLGWRRLIQELLFDDLDPEVLQWLSANIPLPRAGLPYRKWVDSQWGLARLVQHAWTVIGMAAASESIHELREQLAEHFGRVPVHLTFYLRATEAVGSYDPPSDEDPRTGLCAPIHGPH
jgi:hypothetical protein